MYLCMYVCMYVYVCMNVYMYVFFNCMNTHAPLHRSNTTCFIIHFRYWECSDQIGQWIPFTGVIVTSLPTCTYKGNICNCYNRSKFMDFKNSKDDFWCLEIISCLLAGQFPDFMTLHLNISLCLFSIAHWYSKWCKVWSPLPQGQSAFSRILKRWR
jgi:hypothetical protein